MRSLYSEKLVFLPFTYQVYYPVGLLLDRFSTEKLVLLPFKCQVYT